MKFRNLSTPGPDWRAKYAKGQIFKHIIFSHTFEQKTKCLVIMFMKTFTQIVKLLVSESGIHAGANVAVW